MKILIYGTGGVGGYFGARLAQVGNDVTFIARGKHLEAIQNNGLYLKSIEGDYHVHPAQATDNISSLTPDFDLIILGVKSWQVEEASHAIKCLLKEHTLIVPLQNGVDNADKIGSIIDSKYVLIGFCKFYAKIESFGVINHFGYPPELLIGELDNQKSKRILDLKEKLDTAAFKTTIPPDIQSDLWKKFLFICSVSGLGALTNMPIGAMYEDIEIRDALKKELEEMVAVALAKGISLPENMVQKTLNFIGSQAYESTASTQRDILEGRPSELENFNGYIVNEGKKLGIETPVNQFVYSSLLPLEEQARKVK